MRAISKIKFSPASAKTAVFKEKCPYIDCIMFLESNVEIAKSCITECLIECC